MTMKPGDLFWGHEISFVCMEPPNATCRHLSGFIACLDKNSLVVLVAVERNLLTLLAHDRVCYAWYRHVLTRCLVPRDERSMSA